MPIAKQKSVSFRYLTRIDATIAVKWAVEEDGTKYFKRRCRQRHAAQLPLKWCSKPCNGSLLISALPDRRSRAV